jgi:hypothetical protein
MTSDDGVVFLRDGKTYVGVVEAGDRFVCLRGKRRVAHGDGFIYPARGEWCWPWAKIVAVRSLRDQVAA